MISAEGKGKRNVEDQSRRSADDRGAENNLEAGRKAEDVAPVTCPAIFESTDNETFSGFDRSPFSVPGENAAKHF
jgi:hypothetical protein